MRIGIIGTGHIGKTLVQRLSPAGHGVKVANSRGPDTITGDILSQGGKAVTSQQAVRDVAMQLVDDTGLDAVYSGTLKASWRQQPGSPVYCTDLTRNEIPAALAATERSRLPKRRDIAIDAIMERSSDGTPANADDIMPLTRALFV